jgi:hypothetical protein
MKNPKYSALYESNPANASRTTDRMLKAENIAKAAVNVASHPHELVSEGVKKVEKFGLQTLQEIDHSRLKMKELSEELTPEENEENFDFLPGSSRLIRFRNAVSDVGS